MHTLLAIVTHGYMIKQIEIITMFEHYQAHRIHILKQCFEQQKVDSCQQASVEAIQLIIAIITELIPVLASWHPVRLGMMRRRRGLL